MTYNEFDALMTRFVEAGGRAMAALCVYKYGINDSNDRVVLELVKALHTSSDVMAALQKDVSEQLREAVKAKSSVSFDDLMADLKKAEGS